MEGRTVHCLFLGGLDSLAVLASNDLNLLSLNHFVRLHLERRILHYECPDVVTQAVRFQVALKGRRSVQTGRGKLMVATHLESGLGLDLLDHSVRQGLVKLQRRGVSTFFVRNDVEQELGDLLENLHGQLGCNSAAGD